MIADSTMELYQCKLMVLHAAYKIDRGQDFRSEVSMAKHFVANALNRIIDRAIQVHGALGYSTDTPLARMASTRAGRASPTAPTKCTSGASRSAPSTPTATARQHQAHGDRQPADLRLGSEAQPHSDELAADGRC